MYYSLSFKKKISAPPAIHTIFFQWASGFPHRKRGIVNMQKERLKVQSRHRAKHFLQSSESGLICTLWLKVKKRE
jgi:hypothetical protein